jgi:hypothetical protein
LSPDISQQSAEFLGRKRCKGVKIAKFCVPLLAFDAKCQETKLEQWKVDTRKILPFLFHCIFTELSRTCGKIFALWDIRKV